MVYDFYYYMNKKYKYKKPKIPREMLKGMVYFIDDDEELAVGVIDEFCERGMFGTLTKVYLSKGYGKEMDVLFSMMSDMCDKNECNL